MSIFSKCRFYAELANARKGAAIVGALIVHPTVLNGRSPKAIATPKGDPNGVACAVWVSPEHLARRCFEVTEAQARAIQPALFEQAEAFERSAEYRLGHAIACAEAADRHQYQQPADERIVARMHVRPRAQETSGETGWITPGSRSPKSPF